MALFTIDDLEFMENKGRDLFGAPPADAAPSASSVSTILGFSKALSVRKSRLIGEMSSILN